MSKDDREETMIKKEKNEDINNAEEGLNRGDIAAQEQKKILRQAKEYSSFFLFLILESFGSVVSARQFCL